MLTRRQALIAAAATVVAGRAQAQAFNPPADLVAAARREGRMVFYTASFTEVEQETIAAFNKRFPGIRIEMVRASGGQLITRVRTEASAGKLVADVVDHSDRVLMKGIEDLFMDYKPPNAADYIEASRVSDKIWPRITPVWCIAYNTELTKTPPTSWMDLTKPTWQPQQIGQVIAPSGGTTWTRIMFERQKLGEDYWAKQAVTKPTLFPSSAPAADAVVRGEVLVAPVIRNSIFAKKRDGAPIEMVFPTEGIPMNPYATGIPKTAANPNAARLFLDWSLSAEGQAFTMREQGNLSSLKAPPTTLDGFDPKVHQVWFPDQQQFGSLREGWTEEWNKTYGYRQ